MVVRLLLELLTVSQSPMLHHETASPRMEPQAVPDFTPTVMSRSPGVAAVAEEPAQTERPRHPLGQGWVELDVRLTSPARVCRTPVEVEALVASPRARVHLVP